MAFIDNTRLKFTQLAPMTKAAGGGTVIQELPKNGILAYILVPVTFSIAGTLSAPNAFGKASVINRITLRVNAGHAIFDVSGAGYHWLVRDMLETHLQDFGVYTNAREAVIVSTNERLDFFIPVAMNMRDETGLLLLQNEQTIVTLSITYEADAVVATGATVTATATPVLAYFEVPNREEDLPNLRVVHQIIEDQTQIAATGQFIHNPPRDAVITGLYYLTPTWTQVQTIIQQSNTIEDWTPNSHQQRYMLTNGRNVVLAGAISGNDRRFMQDWAGTDGLGEFWTMRDVLDTGRLTNFFNRFTFTATGTMLAVRRQVFPLAPPAGG